MRRLVCMTIFLLLAWWAWAQDEEVLRAARFLSGASSDEEVEEYWVSALEARQGRRIRINDAHIRADGILSEYQIASLADYRSTAGDILSWEELALVDGFSPELVAVLRPFLSLASTRLPGAADTVKVRASALVRGTLTSIGGKAKVSGSWWRAGGAWRGKDGTFHGEATFRGHSLLVGDFNARYGQGLAFWSGFSMSSLSTVDAFIRRTPGISPVWSYSSALVHRGAAYTFRTAHAQATVFGGLDGLLGAHGAWMGGTDRWARRFPIRLACRPRWWRPWIRAGTGGAGMRPARLHGKMALWQGWRPSGGLSDHSNWRCRDGWCRRGFPGRRMANTGWRPERRTRPNTGCRWPGGVALAAACRRIRLP